MQKHIQDLPLELLPQSILEIPHPPKNLRYRGMLPPSGYKYLTIVGTRKISNYGIRVLDFLIEQIANYPIIIVSGLAYGTDTYAHEIALKNKMYTIAFPGSGLDDKVLYPRANLNLAHKIEQNGMLISEFKDQDQAKPYFFPQRNRLMAGIADLILVVEANEKSGSMITARLGTEYNREVATIPHSIFSDLSSGSHSLIRNGATLIRNGNDILEILGLRSEKEKGVKIFLETLEPLEKEIMLECQSEIILETLLTHLNKYPPKEIFEALSMLEIKGFIKMEIGQVIPCGILQK